MSSKLHKIKNLVTHINAATLPLQRSLLSWNESIFIGHEKHLLRQRNASSFTS